MIKEDDDFFKACDKIIADMKEFENNMKSELNKMHTTISDYLELVNYNNQNCGDSNEGIKH